MALQLRCPHRHGLDAGRDRYTCRLTMPPNPLPYHPRQREVLRCDYSGLVPPEMCKVRWAVVVSPKFLNRPNLCTVVPLSTTTPQNIQPYHVKLDRDPCPAPSGEDVWAKCDMIMTVSFSRLAGAWSGKRPDGKRNYVALAVSQGEFTRINQGVLAALGLSHLWKTT